MPTDSCTATETGVPAGYTSDSPCSGSLTGAPVGSGTCTITNTLNTSTLTVTKIYSPSGPTTPVNVTVSSCTNGGTPSPASGQAGTTPQAAFTTTISGFSSGATCVVTESVPSGYSMTASTCNPVSITAGGSSCTITNTLNTSTLTVTKIYSPSGPTTPVNVTVSSCTNGGTPSPASGQAGTTPQAAFTTTISGFNSGATCVVTESVPSGYSMTATTCNPVSITVGSSSCTITQYGELKHPGCHQICARRPDATAPVRSTSTS